MPFLPCRFDHLVIAAETLAAGLDWVEARLGVRPPRGGAHAVMGTHNHLLRLGPGEFLEIIAVDPAAPAPDRARWYGLDGFSGPPRLATWVARCDDLAAARAGLEGDLGAILPVVRGDLRWRITVPEDGAPPMGGALPTLIQWEGGRIAADKLPAAGFALRKLALIHPAPARLSDALAERIDDPRLSVDRGAMPGLCAEIACPDGRIARL